MVIPLFPGGRGVARPSFPANSIPHPAAKQKPAECLPAGKFSAVFLRFLQGGQLLRGAAGFLQPGRGVLHVLVGGGQGGGVFLGVIVVVGGLQLGLGGLQGGLGLGAGLLGFGKGLLDGGEAVQSQRGDRAALLGGGQLGLGGLVVGLGRDQRVGAVSAGSAGVSAGLFLLKIFMDSCLFPGWARCLFMPSQYTPEMCGFSGRPV